MNNLEDFIVLYDKRNNKLVIANKLSKKFRALRFEELLNIEDYFEYNK